MYHAIQANQNKLGVHWDDPENEGQIGKGANISSEDEEKVWQSMIDMKVCCLQKKKKRANKLISQMFLFLCQKNHSLKPFRNKGWRWLPYMEKILPVAGATGAHSYAPTEAKPPPLVDHDSDHDSDHVISPALTHNSDEMDINGIIPSATSISATTPSTDISSSTSADILQPPATKQQRLSEDGGASRSTLSAPSEQSQKSEKGKAKASNRSRSSACSTSSTTQRINKVTPSAALIELHGSVDRMTKAIIAASKPPESAEDKAITQCLDAVRLVQECDDGFSLQEKAALIVFFGSHTKKADMYLTLDDPELRRAVIKTWIERL